MPRRTLGMVKTNWRWGTSWLPKEEMIPRSKLDEADAKFDSAMDEIDNKNGEIEQLKLVVKELKKLKNKDQVRNVVRKHSTDQERFDAACAKANDALGNLKSATVMALFHSIRGEVYCPRGEDEWEDARSAALTEEVFNPEDGTLVPGSRKSVVAAQDAIEELSSLIRDLEFEESEFAASFEDENDIPLSIRNKEFWGGFLVAV